MHKSVPLACSFLNEIITQICNNILRIIHNCFKFFTRLQDASFR
jgi:hypothetical protein